VVVIWSLSFDLLGQRFSMALGVTAMYTNKELLNKLLFSIFHISVGIIISQICWLLGIDLWALGLSPISAFFSRVDVDYFLPITGIWLDGTDAGIINFLTRDSKVVTGKIAVFFNLLSVA
jgi:hypothetical protein